MKASAAIATTMERTFHEDQKVIYDFPPLRDSPVILREKVLPCCSNSLRSRPRGRKTLVENFVVALIFVWSAMSGALTSCQNRQRRAGRRAAKSGCPRTTP